MIFNCVTEIVSPKKVLHSVKKCVLRIGLVHSHVSFKVVDIERCLPVTFASWSDLFIMLVFLYLYVLYVVGTSFFVHFLLLLCHYCQVSLELKPLTLFIN